MTKAGVLLRGLALGAVAAYFLDPALGRRRRSIARDKWSRTANRLRHGIDVALRDLNHRAQGLIAETQLLVSHEKVSDDRLVERVRAKLGRCVSHPSAIEVKAHDGRVELTGPILPEEVESLVTAVSTVPGVSGVENHLQPVEDTQHVSALQGGIRRNGYQPDFLQASWAPATRLIVGGLGTFLMLNCLARRTPRAVLAGTAGFFGFMRATTNMELRRLVGMAGGPHGIELQKTINIAAPVEQVFELLGNYHNLPKFMPNIRDIRELEGGHIAGTMMGPGGMEMHFEEIVHRIPNELLTWRTTENATIPYSGTARFAPTEGGTRIDLRMMYNPPGGILGHAVAAMFGADPKTFVDDMLMRAKVTLETGKAPRDAAEPLAEGEQLVKREQPQEQPRESAPSAGQQRQKQPRRS